MADFDIEIADLAADELREIRVFDRRRILDGIHSQLQNQPTLVTRNRKRLDGVAPSFEHVPPIWELRVGEFRIFYDVDESRTIVAIRAVRRKQVGQTTEDVIRENDNS
jgi:mRNA-degrading endonuclease RelE of RelBE toxin-antitoxin system